MLTGGLEYDVHQITASDAQWIEHRQWTAGDIARIFGVPAGLLSLPMAGGVNLTYTNIRDARTELVFNACDSMMAELGCAYESLLGPNVRVTWDVSSYLPPIEAVENQPQANDPKTPTEPPEQS